MKERLKMKIYDKWSIYDFEGKISDLIQKLQEVVKENPEAEISVETEQYDYLSPENISYVAEIKIHN